MFERFTEPARAVVVLAQEESLSLHHHYVGTEHLLMGLLRVGTGAARRALDNLDIRLDDVRSEVVGIVGTGPVNLDEHDAEALRAIGIDLDEVRRRIEETFGPRSARAQSPRPSTRLAEMLRRLHTVHASGQEGAGARAS